MPDPDLPIRVRPLRPEDRESWLQLWTGYLAFYRAHVPEEITELTFQRICGTDQAMIGLVAVNTDDKPIGLAHLVFHPATWTKSDYCYLEDLYVDPAHRGAHVAEALFSAIDDCANRRGTHRVYWHTQQFNGPARSLYDTVGRLTSFVVYERLLD